LELPFTTSATLESCAGRESIEPVKHQRAAIASDDFPLPLLMNKMNLVKSFKVKRRQKRREKETRE
jgi:hypothetical protein